MKTNAILFTGVSTVTTGEAHVPDPGHGEVLIKTAYSCISPGTELRCLAGQQSGAAPWPFIPGYSASGTIVATGAETRLTPGMRVFMRGTTKANIARTWGGHIGHAVCREADVVPLAADVDMIEASTAHLMAIAWRGVRLSGSKAGRRVAVVGLGPIGMFSARLHRAQGAAVFAADLSPERVELARAAGVDAFVPNTDLAESFHQRMDANPDIVVDSTGAPGVLPHTIKIAAIPPWGDDSAKGACFVIQGSYPAEFSIHYQDAFQRELRIILPRDMQPQDLRDVLDLLAKKAVSVRDIVGAIHPPGDGPQVYRMLQDAKGAVLTAALAWG